MKLNSWIAYGFSLLALLISSYAIANDSLASVAAGGLELLKTDSIEIVSETLEISARNIKVKYHFLNTSNRDIKTTVAFPMPAFDDSFIPDGARENQKPLDSFQITVNGIPVPIQKNRVFLVNGIDKTSQFRNIGLTNEQIFDPNFSCFSEFNRDEQRCKLSSEQSATINHMQGAHWQIKETAYWEQIFPAGKEIEVIHEYTPFTGIQPSGHIGEDGCPNEGSQQAIDRIAKKNTDEEYETSTFVKKVEYILGTGRNWSGPIRDFHLKVRKDSPDEILSLCFPGKGVKTSPTTIEFHQENLNPQNMLAIYFVSVSRGGQNPDGPLFEPASEPILTESQILSNQTLQSLPTLALFAGYMPIGKWKYIDGSFGPKGNFSLYGFPEGITTDKSGNVFSADDSSRRIVKITPDGVVTEFAGASPHNGDGSDVDGPANVARFGGMLDLAIDLSGNIFATEVNEGKIRRVASDGTASTLIDGEYASFYDAKRGIPVLRKNYQDGKVSMARFTMPSYIAVDRIGNIFITDNGSYLVRKISVDGIVSTLAGSPFNSGDDDGNGSKATLRRMSGIAIDSKGNVFVSEKENNRIRKISPDGVVLKFAGSGRRGNKDGDRQTSSFSRPSGLAVDKFDNLYVADTGNNLIRRISATGEVKTIAGNGRNKLKTGLLPGGLNNPTSLGIYGDRLYIGSSLSHYIAVVNHFDQIK
jgi:hypothetical protein